jgi:hypothetical protein
MDLTKLKSKTKTIIPERQIVIEFTGNNIANDFTEIYNEQDTESNEYVELQNFQDYLEENIDETYEKIASITESEKLTPGDYQHYICVTILSKLSNSEISKCLKTLVLTDNVNTYQVSSVRII